MKQYICVSKVWLYPGMAGWHFVGVEKKHAAILKKQYGKGRPGFGAIPVVVTLGTATWKTSIFPDKYSGTYLLPLKAGIRKKEDIQADDTVTFSFSVDSARL